MENNSASFGSSEAAALGGKARAEKLTPEQRKASSQKAALARWGRKEIPRAIKEAPLKIGEIEFECAVLEDSDNIDTATRVISERAFSRAIGAKRGGSHWQRKKKNPGGANLPVFLSANNLRSFISLDLAAALSEPIVYLSEGGPAYGIRAELIPQILDVWLKARDADKLTEKQKRFAKLAEIIARGLMTTGLIALIDEATGIQKLRSQNALAKFLEAYIAKELRKYAKAFSLNWFQEICRLKGIPFPDDMKLPRYFGHIINDLVWDRLAPGIKDELRKKNPVLENGRRGGKHHRWLTEDIGDPKLQHHLGILEGLARGHADGQYDAYHAQVDIVLPSYRKMPLLAYAKDHREGKNKVG